MATSSPIPFRARHRAWMARRSRVGRLTLRLLFVLLAAILLRSIGFLDVLDDILIVVSGTVLLPLLIILFYRWVTQRVLWKVRNRLILTYLLMGLSPVVLFGTLGGIAAYLLAGQYATSSALSVIDQESMKLKDETASEAAFALGQSPAAPSALHHSTAYAASRVAISVLQGNTWHPLITPASSATLPALPLNNPGWLQPSFHGVVSDASNLFLCSVATIHVNGHPVTVLGSMPLDRQELDQVASGLGTVTVLPGFTNLGRGAKRDGSKPDAPDLDNADVDVDSDGSVKLIDKDKQKTTIIAGGKPQAALPQGSHSHFDSIQGGTLRPAAHLYDVPVFFSSSVDEFAWHTGELHHTLLTVSSRPTLLFAHLFATSVEVGFIVRTALIVITIFFALLELLTLLMALGLSRTITRAVADLYRGTREIDAGNLAHRVRVARHDQLGALAGSFNGMAASVSDLLAQQREQQKLLNELAIAQEVQTTLFPHSPALLGGPPGGLEMHAICRPARTVGGDYFDFIFGSHSGLCLALGDISGKGISAALLMASLHSAVRAFSLGQDEGAGRIPSPALLLKLLNRHLYLSTQSARYATLFLAFYDPPTKSLTYSNGGHLPPMLLSTDGTVRRLDCGGSVVGLLEELDYEQATVQIKPGDLLVAFTDGLTEPENGGNQLGQEFGEERLLSLMQQHLAEPLPTLAATTLKTLQTWIGPGEQPDDMTILLARQL